MDDWIVVDLSGEEPVETTRPATADEIKAADAALEAIEAREKNPPLTIEQRLAALEANRA